MDPGVSAFLTKLEANLEAKMDAQTKAQQTTAAKIDELLAWRPDLERRVADLGDAVAALQLPQPPPTKDGSKDPSARDPLPPPPATHDVPIGPVTGAATNLSGPTGHGVFHLPREPAAASVQTPPPLPAGGQSDSILPPPSLSPFAHASQMLAGLGQAHPSISFPQFTGENPKLWKTLCEQYFSMFGIHSTFWVPMAALNFSGTLQCGYKRSRSGCLSLIGIRLLPCCARVLAVIGTRC